MPFRHFFHAFDAPLESLSAACLRYMLISVYATYLMSYAAMIAMPRARLRFYMREGAIRAMPRVVTRYAYAMLLLLSA